MKASFFEYHRPTQEEFEKLWRSAVFSFDASVLLDLYRFSDASREELLRLLRARKPERIWLTHQSAYEFHKNRLQVIAEAGKRASGLRTALVALQRAVSDDFKQHPFVTSKLCDEISSACVAALQKLDDAEKSYPNLLSDDPIAGEVLDIFDGRVGKPYDRDKIPDLHAQIAARYDIMTPPGYLDRKNKDDERSYGDCILWFQLIAYAKEHKCPVILVTRDLKEDWWLRDAGKTLLPRPELRREFRESTGGYDFYLYQTPNFIEFAKEYKGSEISDRLIQESRVIAEASEVRRAEQRATSEGGGEPIRKASNERRFPSGSLKISQAEFDRIVRELRESLLRRRGSAAEPVTGQNDQSSEGSPADVLVPPAGEDPESNTG